MSEHRRVSIGGAPVAYRAHMRLQQREGRVVVFLHGAGGSAGQFESLLRALPRRPGSIAIDLPGHGDSGGFAPASLACAADVVAELLDALALTRPVACVGHSFGGLVALELAVRHASRVGRIATLASAASFRIHPDFARQALSGSWDRAALRRVIAAGDVAVDAVLADLRRLRLAPGSGLGALAACDITARLAQVRVPALCLVPAADTIISPRRGRALARALPHGRAVTIAGTGHYMHLERPAAVAAALRDFLAADARLAVAAA
jgi:pimeloyl-ACP methyl ester carboxylesterase